MVAANAGLLSGLPIFHLIVGISMLSGGFCTGGADSDGCFLMDIAGVMFTIIPASIGPALYRPRARWNEGTRRSLDKRALLISGAIPRKRVDEYSAACCVVLGSKNHDIAWIAARFILSRTEFL